MRHFFHTRNRWLYLIVFALIPFILFSTVMLFTEAQVYWGTHTPFQSLSFKLQSALHTESVSCYWSAEEGKYYLFLPAYADNADTTISTEYYPINCTLKVDDALCLSGSSVDFLTDSMEYTLSFYNWRGALRESETLVVMKSQNLASLFINTASGTMEQIHADIDYKESGFLSAVAADGSLAYSGSLKYLKGRGNTTWSCGKKPYNLALEQPSALLTLAESDRFVLLANACDGTHLRNKIAYDAAAAIGMPYSPESEFVDLYLNGTYAGLYQLAEKTEVAPNRIDIRNLDDENQAVNTGSLANYDTFDTSMRRGFSLPNSPSDISGGYLLEFDRRSQYDLRESAFIADSGQTFILRSPEFASQEEVDYIADYVQQVEAALNADGKASPFGSSIEELIDVDSFVNAYLLAEVFQNVDAYYTSQYLYKLPDSQGGLLHSGPIWDFDRTLGNHSFSSWVHSQMLFANQQARNPWIYRCYSSDWFQETLQENYSALILPVLQQLLNGKIDAYADIIAASAKMDRIRCRYDTYYLIDNEDWQFQLHYLKDYLNARTAFLINYWLSDAAYHTIHLNIDSDLLTSLDYVVADGQPFTPPAVPEKQGCHFVGWYYEGTEIAFDPQDPIYETISLTAVWTENGES